MKRLLKFMALVLLSGPVISVAAADGVTPEGQTDVSGLPGEESSEPNGEKSGFKLFRKKPDNLLLVPIPMSSPTFGTGLILGGAYFYPQTEEQKSAQPASFTGAAAGYTSNDSWFGGVMQQNYWNENRWRFTGVASYLDFKLELRPPATGDGEPDSAAWLVNGGFFQARLSRKLWSDWYLGVTARYLDISQAIDLDPEDEDFNLQSEISATGIGLNLEFDSRDSPFNAYDGRHFELKAMTSDQSGSENESYQSYQARIRSYHSISETVVLAWDVSACWKSGRVPLWDTCRLGLRGFSATDYLGKQSVYAQAEARWRFHKRWGMVAFAGAGQIDDSFGSRGEDETIPSYGVGVRFMVLESQRINVRVDYARSDKGSDAWYLSVTEAF